jgi:capsular polysaccharide biosynthesis protein
MDGELGLRRHLAVLRKAWRLIGLMVLMGLSVAFVVNAVAPRLYESHALINVGPVFDEANPDVNALLAAQRVAGTFASLAGTRQFLEQVRSDAGLRQSVDELIEGVSAVAVPESLYISISYQDGDRVRAAETANAIADGLIKIAPNISGASGEDAKPLRLVDPAVPSAEPVSPRGWLNFLAGLIGGVLAGLGVAYARAYIRDEVDDERDAEDLAQVPVLGRVRVEDGSLMRPEEREALAWLAKRIELLNGDGSRITLTPAGPAAVGWLGATLAERYAAGGRSTVLVRLDKRDRVGADSAAFGFDRLLSGDDLDPKAVPSGARKNLRVLSGGMGLEAAAENASRDRTQSAVAGLEQLGDLAVIVTDPPLDSLAALLVAPEASSVILVIDASHARRRDVAAAASTLRQVGARLVGVALVEGAEPLPSTWAVTVGATRELAPRPAGDAGAR